MPPISMSPGTVLDGRYRLDVLLSEHDGARFWRATDTVLARSVAVHVVPSDDERAPAVLAAARRSATVTDPHFLRVLDCDDVDGVTWVINEWGEGTSLDIMLASGTLPPMRAAWLTREVAEAITAAHAQGLVHGRLNPEAVLVTEAGSVKLIGFVVNAAFERSSTTTSASAAPYSDLGPRETDVVDLAGILYAALTGRWPGISPSSVPRAPREGARTLRPRQVRAGVPRTLDAICDRVLHKEASQHILPIESAFEIAAALTDYVGDPVLAAPVDLPSMHDDPASAPPAEPETSLGAVPPVVEPVVDPVVEPSAEAAPEPAPPAPDAGPDGAPEPAPEPAPEDPDATMAAPAPFSPSGIEYLELDEWEPAAPPPPFEQPADRPLFADSERRVPAAAAPAHEPQAWRFADEPGTPPPPPARRRSRARVVVLVLMALALIGAMYVAYQEGTRDEDPSAAPTTGSTRSSTPTPTPSAPLTGAAVTIVDSGDFDPEGDSPEENPRQVPNATDGDPTTAWKTVRYTQAALGGLKSGVGLVLDLGTDTAVSSVEVTLVGSPTSMELWATAPGVNDPPVELADTRRLGGLVADSTSAVFRLSTKPRTRYLVLWLTKLPAAGSGFQGQVAEITVRS